MYASGLAGCRGRAAGGRASPTGLLLGRLEGLGFQLRDQADLETITADVLKSSEIEGERLDLSQVRSSIARQLGLEIAGASVVVLGAGGVGRVAALKLASEKAGELFLVNRTASKAAALAEEIQKRFPGVNVTVGYPPPGRRVTLALNATSLGLKPDDAPPFQPREFNLAQAQCAYDTIYRPAETPFLRAARAAGGRTANGLGMLLYQGAAALELWSGRPAPLDVMRAALRENVYG